MNFIKRIINSFAWQMGKFLFLVALIALIIFLKGTKVLALEVSDWTESDTLLITEVDSTPYYTYDNYDSSVIMNNIYNWSNEHFFESSYTIEEFYSIFTYVIYSVDESTIRAYVQNAPLVLDWQGISSTANDIIFYLSNVVGIVDNGSRYAYGVGIIYSYYIDINLDNLSYVISSNNPLLDVSMNKLTSVTSGDTSYNLNIKMLDSYNGNISWISTWNDLYNNSGLWRSISGYTGSLSVVYSTNPNVVIPDFLYTSPGVTPVPPDEPDDPEVPDFDLESNLKDILENAEKIEENTWFGKTILENIEDVLENISSKLSDIYDSIISFFSSFFDYLLELLNSFFIPEDLDILIELKDALEEKLGFIITIPEMLIQFLIDLINVEWEKVESITFPSIEIAGFYFWEEQEIDITPLINVIEPYKFYTNFACVIMMVSGIVKYYYSFFDGNGGE